jgi:hypothetical protein
MDHYINNYETRMKMMKQGRNYLPQDFFIDRFISGLKDNIKHTIQCQKPDTQLSANWYAQLYEKTQLSIAHRPTQFQQQNPLPARHALACDLGNREGQAREKEPRKCWYCPENWDLVIGVNQCKELSIPSRCRETQMMKILKNICL